MRPSIDRYFMDMARLVASRSTCLRRSVGCVLIDKRRHVLATGYNGVAAGAAHCNEPAAAHPSGTLRFPHACRGANARSGQALDSCFAVHAEQNAILQCSDVYSIDIAYVTTFPCSSCTKLLLNTSCHTIIFASLYSDDSLSAWSDAGRVARMFNDDEPASIYRDVVTVFGCDALTPWRLAIAHICSRSSDTLSVPTAVMRILRRWPTPQRLYDADISLEAMLRALGLSMHELCELRDVSRSVNIHGGLNIVAPAPLIDRIQESINVFCHDKLPDVCIDPGTGLWVEWRRRRVIPQERQLCVLKSLSYP